MPEINYDVSSASPTRASSRSSRGLFSSSTLMHMSAEVIMFGIVIVYFSFTTGKLRSQVARLTNQVASQGEDIETLKNILLQLKDLPVQPATPPPDDKLRKEIEAELRKEIEVELRKEIEEEVRQAQAQAQAQAQVQAQAQARQVRRVMINRAQPRVVQRRQQVRTPQPQVVRKVVAVPVKQKAPAPAPATPKIEVVEETAEELDGLLKSELAELNSEKPSNADLD